MHTLEIPSEKTFLYFPEHLGECDARQYADMAKLMWMFQSGKLKYEEFKSLAVYALLNMKQSGKKDEAIFTAVFQLSELVDSFFDKTVVDGRDQLKPVQFYVNNHLPRIKAGFFKTYIGPEDVFEDVEFGQYVDGLEEFINFSQTGDIAYLRKLFAIFYLPKGEKYEPKTARLRAKSVFRVTDIRHLYGFYLYFSAMQLFIMSGEIWVNGNAIDLSIIYENGTADKNTLPGIGMYGLLHDIAESGVFGPYELTRRANLWAILRRLYQLQKKQSEENNKNNVTPSV